MKRGQETKGLDGFDAVRLWYKYVDGDYTALELLKKYNQEDIIGLKILAQRVYSIFPPTYSVNTIILCVLVSPLSTLNLVLASD